MARSSVLAPGRDALHAPSIFDSSRFQGVAAAEALSLHKVPLGTGGAKELCRLAAGIPIGGGQEMCRLERFGAHYNPGHPPV